MVPSIFVRNGNSRLLQLMKGRKVPFKIQSKTKNTIKEREKN
jgi:hypothetical protein